MKKQSKLLKVISILLIIFGALGALGSFASAFLMQAVMQSPEMQAAYEATGVAQPSNAYYIFSIVAALVELIVGIVGVMYRSKKSVLIAGIIWVICVVIGQIWSITLTSFSAVTVFSIVFAFVLPVLYLWGWYQSN